MAAAYLTGIVSNHPFMDGNKRTGTHAATLFLYQNGFKIAKFHQAKLQIWLWNIQRAKRIKRPKKDCSKDRSSLYLER